MPVKTAAGYAEIFGDTRNADRVDALGDEDFQGLLQPVEALQLIAFRGRGATLGDGP